MRGSRSAGRRAWWWLATALSGFALVASAAPGFGATGNSAAAPRVSSIQDSPGYVRPFDPESMSVVVGRRTNAPMVSKRFTGGARSLDALGRSVCRALTVGAPDSLLALCVRANEFRDILWREFPQSRPATGLQWEDGWRTLSIRLLAGCHQAVHDYAGQGYELVGITADSTAHYRNFTLHSRLRFVVRDDEGQMHELAWLRAVAERRGRFKIYSTQD